MNENSKNILVNQLFSIPVALMPEEYVLTTDELEFINGLEEKGISGGDGGNVASENHYLCESKELKNLKDYFQRNLESYAYDVMKISNEIEFYVTQSWCNFNKKETGHHKHWHANSVFSAVYFIDGGNTPIEFFRPIPMNNFLFKTEEYTMWNSDRYYLPNLKNRLYIFPSTLVHGVWPNKEDTTRKSISFNSFFRGTVGEYLGATELKL